MGKTGERIVSVRLDARYYALLFAMAKDMKMPADALAGAMLRASLMEAAAKIMKAKEEEEKKADVPDPA